MSESMREEFEDFASDQYEWPQAIEKNADGEYKLMTTYQAWITWQASRAALCVELPLPVKRAFHEYDLGYNEALDHCEEAIHAAGVKTR